VRLGRSEYYDPHLKDSAGRRFARHYYFNAILENEADLLYSLSNEVYPEFLKLSLVRSYWPLSWQILEIAVKLAEHLPLSQEGTPDEVLQAVAALAGGTPKEVSRFYHNLKNWRNSNVLAKVDEWVFELIYSHLTSWAGFGLEPGQSKLYAPEEMSGSPEQFSLSSFVNYGKFEVPPFTFKLLPIAYGEGTYLRRSVELGDDGSTWLYDSKHSEYLSWSYEPMSRTRAEEGERIEAAFKDSLSHYLEACKELALKGGLRESSTKRKRKVSATDHFTWLYLRHVRGLTYKKIADNTGIGISEAAVHSAVKETAEQVGIDLT